MATRTLADRVLLSPRTQPLSCPSEQRMVGDPADLQVCVARSDPSPEPPRAVVLHFVGSGGRAEEDAHYFAQWWAGHDVELWALNYPGYGSSTGPARLAALAPAGRRLHAHASAARPGLPLLVSGNSIGAAVALHVAASLGAAGVFLRNPPPLRELILRRFGWWNAWLLAAPVAQAVPEELDSLANAQRCVAPVAMVVSELDVVVPPSFQRLVLGRCAGPTRLAHLRYAGHHSHPTDAQMTPIRAALAWLAQQGAWAR